MLKLLREYFIPQDIKGCESDKKQLFNSIIGVVMKNKENVAFEKVRLNFVRRRIFGKKKVGLCGAIADVLGVILALIEIVSFIASAKGAGLIDFWLKPLIPHWVALVILPFWISCIVVCYWMHYSDNKKKFEGFSRILDNSHNYPVVADGEISDSRTLLIGKETPTISLGIFAFVAVYRPCNGSEEECWRIERRFAIKRPGKINHSSMRFPYFPDPRNPAFLDPNLSTKEETSGEKPKSSAKVEWGIDVGSNSNLPICDNERKVTARISLKDDPQIYQKASEGQAKIFFVFVLRGPRNCLGTLICDDDILNSLVSNNPEKFKEASPTYYWPE